MTLADTRSINQPHPTLPTADTIQLAVTTAAALVRDRPWSRRYAAM